MATKIKALIIKIPQLDSAENVDEQAEIIEDQIKNKINDGYTFLGSVGGDYFGIIILKKD